MALKKPKSSKKSSPEGVSSERAQKSEIVSRTGNAAIIRHQQSIKQSLNYQSAECVYGVELTVPDNDKSIAAGFKRAEELIETPLVDKFELQRETLERLT